MADVKPLEKAWIKDYQGQDVLMITYVVVDGDFTSKPAHAFLKSENEWPKKKLEILKEYEQNKELIKKLSQVPGP
jgi:hypothetical protein